MVRTVQSVGRRGGQDATALPRDFAEDAVSNGVQHKMATSELTT